MKPKIIQSSKDMLSRSFNPAKCKTALKLGASRLKLLRNKKEIHVKQMKKEIAVLLESGQEQTARIRVEHVIREEKMMAAYDLLGIYCELIVARMPMIETQKSCPIDLKEAVTSVLFASPRCGDVPELLDVKKNLMAKYGRDFTTAAVELRPQCGVSRLLVEKLSAASPDGQTKIKILEKIAGEHNVAWTSMSLDEKDVGPHMDFQIGPCAPRSGTHGRDCISDAEPLRFETTEVKPHMDNVTMRSSLSNSLEDVQGHSAGTKKLTSASTSSVSMSTESRARSSADDTGQSFQADIDNNYLDRQKWNSEFKDAASPVRAAFESAGRASAADRAVAEFSIRDVGDNCYKPDESNVRIPEHEVPPTYRNRKTSWEEFTRFENENRLPPENAGRSSKKIDDVKPTDSKRQETFENVTAGVPETSSSIFPKREVASFSNFVDPGIPLQQDFPFDPVGEVPLTDEPDEFLMDGSRKESSSDYDNFFAISEDQRDEKDGDRDHFQRIGDGGINNEGPKISSDELSGIIFDSFESDKDDGFTGNPIYDVGDDMLESLPFNVAPFSSPEFPETMPKSGSELDDMGPATFDDSDGFSPEHDDNMRTRHRRAEDARKLCEQIGVGHSLFDEKHMQPAYDDWKSEETNLHRNIKFDDEESNMNSKDFCNNDSSFSESRLDIEKLTGGFRQKNSLASLANQLGVSLSFKKKEDAIIAKRSHNPPAGLRQRMHVMPDGKWNSRESSDMGFESSDEEEKTSKQETSYATTKDLNRSRLEASDPSSSLFGSNLYEDSTKRMETSSSLGAQASIHDSDSSNLHVDPSKNLSIRSRVQDGVISRRTKASSSTVVANSDNKSHLPSGSEPRDSDDLVKGNTADVYRQRANSAASSDINSRSKGGYKLETGGDIDARRRTESPRSHQPKGRIGSQSGPFDQSIVSKSETSDSEVLVSPKIPLGKASPRKQDAMFSQKSIAASMPSSPERKPAPSTIRESPKTPTSGDVSRGKPESIRKTSHVHPKLPDYDTLVQSLRRRQS